MKALRDLPIQRKLLVITLIICSVVMLAASAALFAFQLLHFHSSFERETAALSAIVASNTKPALVSANATTAAEVLRSLRAYPPIVTASLVSPSGRVLAHYGKPEAAESFSQFPPAGESRFTRRNLLRSQPVALDTQGLGMLYLRFDYWEPLMTVLEFDARVMLVVILASVGLAVFLASRLRHVITDPVLSLVEAARLVGEKNDYSVRANLAPRADEFGRLGDAFNQMLQRIENQNSAYKESQHAELNLSREKLRSLIDSLDGIVWECAQKEDCEFTFISRQAERLLGYTPEEWLAQPRFWQEKLHPDDAAQALQSRHDLVARGKPYHLEYRLLAADGRAVWIRESAVVLTETSRPTTVRGIFQDITEQKRAAEQFTALNRKLVETSRQAGMAEVATGVLHNVGNVLNSMNVSVTLMRERLQKSKAANLMKVVELLRQHREDLGTYVTTDPRGKMIPGYLDQLAAQLVKESDDALSVVELVTRSMDHIKKIVSMQQDYAKVTGLPETLPAATLIEDALQINESALERHGIQVVRAYAAVPPVTVDKHKVLQILINLVRNAKYALDESERPDKMLRLGVSANGDGHLKITVADNGVGIKPENLTRIFAHGFTTRKEGHGFGLHSGANAAREMGGRLTASSDGLGKGAEFTLELPLSRPVTAMTP